MGVELSAHGEGTFTGVAASAMDVVTGDRVDVACSEGTEVIHGDFANDVVAGVSDKKIAVDIEGDAGGFVEMRAGRNSAVATKGPSKILRASDDGSDSSHLRYFPNYVIGGVRKEDIARRIDDDPIDGAKPVPRQRCPGL